MAMALLPWTGGCQWLQDQADQRALRQQAQIPRQARTVVFEGFPWRNGFGQREGLLLYGRYWLPQLDRHGWERAVVAKHWRPLPLAAADRLALGGLERSIPARLPLRGFYRCHTAGDDVLHAARTRPCSQQTRPPGAAIERLNDVIFSTYEPATGQLSAVVASLY